MHVKNILIPAVAELLASAILVFFGCLGCIDLGIPGLKPNHLTICISFGLTVMLIVNVFGMVSGAHISPAVTVAALVYKLVDFKTAVAYIVGQFVGAFVGYALLRAVISSGDPYLGESFCVTLPTVHPVRAFAVEFMITMGLVLLCCGVWDPRNAKHHDSVPLRFGCTIIVLALVGGPFTGGSMNPARSFAPALYNMNWDHHWIYWAAPFSSAFITSFLFKKLFYKEPEV